MNEVTHIVQDIGVEEFPICHTAQGALHAGLLKSLSGESNMATQDRQDEI